MGFFNIFIILFIIFNNYCQFFCQDFIKDSASSEDISSPSGGEPYPSESQDPHQQLINSGSSFQLWNLLQYSILKISSPIIFLTIALGILFIRPFALYSIVKLLRSLVLDNVQQFFDQYIFKTAIRVIIFGMLLTIMVQSSSITTSTIVPLAGAGVLTLRQVYPFPLGANIGTTITAILAALTLNVTALVAAFAHLFFNLYGILFIYMNPLFRDIPIKLSIWISEVAVKN